MPNEIFKRAIFDALTQEYDNSVPETEYHVFSQRFEKKMEKLIKRRKKPYYKMVNTFGKRAACFAAGVLVAFTLTIMNVEAFRNAFIDFFIRIFEKFSIVQSVENINSPEKIEEIYNITYDLSGYVIDYEEYDDYSRNITYINGNNVVDYFQYAKSAYDMLLNTENADIETIIIDHHKAIYYKDNRNYHHIIWDNGEYIISLSSNVGKNELIDIANSVQKVE